ncbi:uncharacterized protein LOC144882766 [Branchiostoma floridae x Branchiostoma japonicum]
MASSRIINIPFQEQERRLLSQLNRMREQDQLCDMTVRVGTREFRCHQAVLAASSGHFLSVFVQGMLSFPKILDLTFTSADVFSIILDFIYTASLKCPADVLAQVLQAAKVLEIHTLVDHLLLFSAAHDGVNETSNRDAAQSTCTSLPVLSGVFTPVSSVSTPVNAPVSSVNTPVSNVSTPASNVNTPVTPGTAGQNGVVVKQDPHDWDHVNPEEFRPQSEVARLQYDPMATQIAELRSEVAFLRQQLNTAIGEEPVSVQSPAKRLKRGNSSLLSGTVRRLHNADTNPRKYRGDLGLNSPHNEAVTTFLMREVAATSESEHHPQTVIRAACVTYYETVRRRFVDEQPENTEKTKKQKSEKRLRSRRKRLLECREGVLQSEEERWLWTGVTPDLMSDEDDSESDGIPVWLVRPPAFRSDKLSSLCGVLQSRLDADKRFRSSHTPRKTDPGVFSERLPPKSYDPERATQHIRPEHAPNKLRFIDDVFTDLDL